MKHSLNQYLKKNYIINDILTQNQWEHVFIKENETPYCDLKNKKLYLIPFSYKDDKITEKIKLYLSIHENAHALFTPYEEKNNEYNEDLCFIINTIQDLRIEKKLNQFYHIDDLISFSRKYLIDKIDFQNLNNIKYIIVNLMARSLNIFIEPIKFQSIISDLFPLFEQWKNITLENDFKAFQEVVNISNVIYRKLFQLLPESLKSNQKHNIMKYIQQDVFVNINNLFQHKEYLIDSSNDCYIIPQLNCQKYKSFFKKKYFVNNIIRNKLDLKDQNKKINHYNLNKGLIDFNKLVDITKSLNTNIFYRNDSANKMNVGISILVDQSYSMDKNGFKDIFQNIIYLSQFLEKNNFTFQIIGSNTQKPPLLLEPFVRTVPINTYMYKQFDEKFSNVKYRLGNIEAKNHFVDNECIEAICQNMLKYNFTKKFLFLFSDGKIETGQGVNQIMTNILIDKINYYQKKGFRIYCCTFIDKYTIQIYNKRNILLLKQNNQLFNLKLFSQILNFSI